MAKRDTPVALDSAPILFHPCPAHLAPTRTLLYGHILQGLLAATTTNEIDVTNLVDAAVGLTNEALLRLEA